MKKRLFISTILCVSLFQMGMVALSPVISAITNAFPGTSDMEAQLAATFLNLVLVICALLSSVIARKIGRRRMVVLGVGLTAIVGILAPLLTTSLWLVYLWSGLLGAGTGLFTPAISSMIIDYLDNDERQKVAGVQTAAVNLGGMILSLLAGILASRYWNHAYLVFLLAVPTAVLCCTGIPREPQTKTAATEKATHTKLPVSVILATIQTTIFAIIYFAFTTNVSLLMVEKGHPSTTLSGIATACFMCGGCIFGFLFAGLFRTLKGKTAAGAYVLLASSYFLIFSTQNLPLLLIGAFVGGGSLSIIFPYFLVSIAGKVDSTLSVLATSLILSVGPNLGSFVSPVIITGLTNLFGGESIASRFLLAAVAALLIGGLLILIDTVVNRQINAE